MRTEAQLRRAAAHAGVTIHEVFTVETPYGPTLSSEWSCDDGWQAARFLRELALEDANDPDVWKIAERIRQLARGGDLRRTLHQYVFENVRFEPEDIETFQSPLHTLLSGVGDCDDHAGLIIAVAWALGLQAELVFLEEGGQPAHVFVCFFDGGMWTPAETTIAALYGEPPLLAAERLGESTRPDLSGIPVTVDRKQLTIAGLGDLPDVSELARGIVDSALTANANFGGAAPIIGSKTRWQDDPDNTREAYRLFQAAAPIAPDSMLQILLAVAALETGIGKNLGGNNYGAIVCTDCSVPDTPASLPPQGTCCPSCVLATDRTRAGDPTRRWRCFQAWPTKADAAASFVKLMYARAPSTLSTGNADKVAAEMYKNHYYGYGDQVSPGEKARTIALYAQAIAGAASVIAKHLEQNVLVSRSTTRTSAIAWVGLGAATIGIAWTGYSSWKESA